jgi:putative acetyltransferase
LRLALDSVARERRYLALTAAPPPEECLAFYRNIVTNDLCQFVALQDDSVVGWCDILPVRGEACAHIGILSMGLVAHARHAGIGAKLMEASLSKAWTKGLSRIALTVRTDNVNAKALYERFGFVCEGLLRRAFCVDGEFFDCYAMALLR